MASAVTHFFLHCVQALGFVASTTAAYIKTSWLMPRGTSIVARERNFDHVLVYRGQQMGYF